MLAKKEILDLISKGETGKAIGGLLEDTRLLDDELHQEVALQSAKYEQYKKDERRGTQDAGNQEVRLSRINHALVEIVRRLPDGKLVDSIYAPTGNDFNKPITHKYIGIIILGIIALSLITIALFLPDRNTFEKKDIPIIDLPAQKKNNGVPTPGKGKSKQLNDDTGTAKSSPIEEISETISSTPLFDTITLILNSPEASVLIDNDIPVLLAGSTAQVKYLQVSKNARVISLTIGSTKCTKPLRTFGERIYQNQVCN
jgi:hypothetical protein